MDSKQPQSQEPAPTLTTLTLTRFTQDSERTLGTRGTIDLPDDTRIYTLELPWKNNEVNISCIPTGEYLCKYSPYDPKQRWSDNWIVQDVANRGQIEIHPANFLKQLEGCIAPGMSQGLRDDADGREHCVWNSGGAMAELRKQIGQKDFILKIVSA